MRLTAEPAMPEDWTAIGVAGSVGTLGVDAGGRVVTGRTGWSLGWWVDAGDRRHVPAEERSLRRRRVGEEGAAPVGLETVLRTGDGEVVQRVYACLPSGVGAGALGVLEVHNRTSAPVGVTLLLTPGDFHRPSGLWRLVLESHGAEVNGAAALWWDRPPAAVVLGDGGSAADLARFDDSVVQPPAAAALAGGSAAAAPEVAEGEPPSLRQRARPTGESTPGAAAGEPAGFRRTVRPTEVPGTGDGPSVVEVPVFPQRVRSRRGLAAAALTWPVTHGTALRVLLPLADTPTTPPPPEAVPTLAQVGRGWEAHTAGGLRLEWPENPAPAAAAAAAGRRLLATDIDDPAGPDGRFSGPERALLAAGLAVAGFARQAAEAVTALAARRPHALAEHAAREAARVTARWGADLAAMAAAAASTGAWVTDRAGDDPLAAAAYLLRLRDTLVSQSPRGLDLLPTGSLDLLPTGSLDLGRGLGLGGLPVPATTAPEPGTPGPPVEVHHLGTRFGLLSYALRWHGPTPALLWELTPPRTALDRWAATLAGPPGLPDHDEPLPEAPYLSATVLAPTWQTTQPTGEQLLRPPS